jgi:UDP-N-acetylmuramate dehydrogenase
VDEERRRVLRAMLGKKVAFEQPMEHFTTLRVGGNAEALCFVEDLVTLERILVYGRERDIPCLVIGKGSNLLVTDQGVRGLVILLRGELASIERSGERLFAGAGLPLSKLLHCCRKQGLGGLEFLAGIPGTVGGAVAMNAGAWGKETAGAVQEIRIMVPSGEVITMNHSELSFSYRHLLLPQGAVIATAVFRCSPETPAAVSERLQHYMALRKSKQPLEYASAGSVFKNPPKDYAGRLIEMVGLKGCRVGGAMISPKHANFIVNTGGARASDVLALMEMARRKVKADTGIELEPEMRVVGK